MEETLNVNYKRRIRLSLAVYPTHGLMVAAFLLWGGLGLLNAPEVPEVLDIFRLQDILTAISSVLLVFVLMAKKRLSRLPVVLVMIFTLLLIHGVLMSLARNTAPRDIAFEARLLIYAITGALVGLAMDVSVLDRMIRLYAVIISGAIVAQFVLVLAGSDILILNGVNPGNAFTLNLPMVRPPGGFHLVPIALVLALGPWSHGRIGLSTLLMLIALIVAQSKTYLSLVLLVLFLNALIGNKHPLQIRLKPITSGIIIIILSSLVLGISVWLVKGEVVYTLPLEKFRLTLTKPAVAHGVVGKRIQEADLMVSSWSDSPGSALLGSGLGYIYRDPSLLFYRTDQRDLERLAMFGHNFFLWFLLKLGLVGLLVFAGAVALSLRSAFQGNADQKRFAVACGVLLAASIFIGSPESPTGAFLLSILLSGSTKKKRPLTEGKAR